ncbi:metallo-beta-lactamase domain-containing protein 1 [Anoplophora glabripennis]|uniref:metallo-beta-lactamase domain-containing protein 1 n=1 Tax=Anoplophora glabripennis TaxID=217634 RepID=UPI00087591A0|nr:metallo-beta-lactamase domain-containing protein 1 [Anoplophora glabripennis]
MDPIVLFDGYSKIENGNYYANCSCVLIKGPPNVIVDTMTAWDGDKLVKALNKESFAPDDINYVVCTHGHSDHIGCNYLFQKAIHIVGHSISYKNKYEIDHDFKSSYEYIINDRIKVSPTPGHTLQDVSVIVNSSRGVTAITGDLFEKFEDLTDDNIWKEAGSDSEELQRINRQKILILSDFIIPGHGPMFKVPQRFKNPG